MRKVRIARNRILRILAKRESGLTLIETLVALAILGAVGVAFLSGLATTSTVAMVSQERVVAESLAKSQLEYIKAQDYITEEDYGGEEVYLEITLSSDLIDGGYSIEIASPESVGSMGAWAQYELQKVTVVVKRDGEELLTVSDHKVGVGS